MNTQNQSIKTLQIIHSALLMGMILFGAVTIFLTKDTSSFTLDENSQLFFVISFILSVGGLFVGNFLYTKGVEKGKNLETNEEKISSFQSNAII